MTPGELKPTLLVTRYSDGAARGMGFLDAHQLLLHYAVDDEADGQPLLIDFEESRVVASKAQPKQTGALGYDAKHRELTVESDDGELEVRGAKGKLVKRLVRAGKRPLVGFSDDGSALYSSATEVLNRWNLKTGRAQKYKCHDRVTHVAAIGGLLAAQNKEGVISLFDAGRGKCLVSVRPAADGWLAFADDGAWDSSPGFKRGVELSWTDAKSTAFVPGQGFGWLELNRFPLTRVVAPKLGRVSGLIALRTTGYW